MSGKLLFNATVEEVPYDPINFIMCPETNVLLFRKLIGIRFHLYHFPVSSTLKKKVGKWAVC
jgi:hypothetical protein